MDYEYPYSEESDYKQKPSICFERLLKERGEGRGGLCRKKKALIILKAENRLLFAHYACRKSKGNSGCVRTGRFNYCERDP